MRPTYLQFRSPKELTPGPYFPKKTIYGGSLDYHPVKNRTTFGNSRRFQSYDIQAKRYLVGPASYKPEVGCTGKKTVRGGHIYRLNSINSNGLYYVGDHLVSEIRSHTPDIQGQKHNQSLLKKHLSYKTP